jgi:hypothetical protein
VMIPNVLDLCASPHTDTRTFSVALSALWGVSLSTVRPRLMLGQHRLPPVYIKKLYVLGRAVSCCADVLEALRITWPFDCFVQCLLFSSIAPCFVVCRNFY